MASALCSLLRPSEAGQGCRAKTAYIEPESLWENWCCESLNARFNDELFNGELFYTLREAKILIEEWRKHYTHIAP